MRKIFSIALFLFAFTGMAYADQFEILHKSENETYPFAHTSMQVFDSNNEMVFKGFTDKYGRITIPLPNGKYYGTIFYKGGETKIDLIIDGIRELKVVCIE